MPRRNSSRARHISLKKRLTSVSGSFQTKIYPKIQAFIIRRPMLSFFLTLGFLLVLIILNSALTSKPQSVSESNLISSVQVYKIGVAPRVTYSAKVDKKGVIQIVAQAPGIVSSINVVEGQTVWRGTNLLSLANNYLGGNALSVSRQLAQVQYDNIKNTYDTQKEIIGRQREIANKTDDAADELRAITDKSISETNDIINLNNEVIVGLQTALDQAITNGNTQDAATIRPLLVQAKSANLQLNQASRGAQFAAAADKPQAQLSNLGRDVALKQLEIQEKAIALTKEVSRLSLVLAQISESSMYPASPSVGVVEKVHVTLGQSVAPGTVLVTISGTVRNAVVTANVPYDTASKVSKMEESILYIKGKTYKLMPDYVSTEATNGLLSSVIYSIPQDAYDEVVDGGYVKVEIPIGFADSISSIPYLPIDIIFQTQDGSFVYVVENGKVASRKIRLGTVVGSSVAIESGLKEADQVILDRNVIEGKSVRISN